MKKFWNIHGFQYDLTSFINYHPGGREILLKTQGLEDLTPLFETYHAFSDKSKINKILEQFKLTENDPLKKNSTKTFDFTDYNNLVSLIKEKTIFKNRRSIKMNRFLVLKSSILMLIYAFFFYTAFFSDANYTLRCVSGFLSGTLWMMVAFNLLHDGSHYALSTREDVNLWISGIWCSWGFWNIGLWFYHHVYGHHSFTGVVDKDPDVAHFHPFCRKDKRDNKIIRIFGKIQHLIIPFLTIIFPGMNVGQVLAYIRGYFRGELWTIHLPNIQYLHLFEIILLTAKSYSLYCGMWIPSILYIIAINLFYHINVVPDHDTLESTIINHDESSNWLKVQTSNSGNFSTSNFLWTHLFGGINYQIEHHLFPNMSHVYYPQISPIVKKYCLDHGYPYAEHPTVLSAYISFLKMMYITRWI